MAAISALTTRFLSVAGLMFSSALLAGSSSSSSWSSSTCARCCGRCCGSVAVVDGGCVASGAASDVVAGCAAVGGAE